MKVTQKIIAILLTMVLMLGQVGTPIALAQEAPPAPPEAPSAPPSAPEAPPSTPEAPTAPEAPSAPSAPTQVDPTPTPAAVQEEQEHRERNRHRENRHDEEQEATVIQEEPVQNSESDGSGNVGDTTIETGNADTNANSDVTANNNVASGISAENGPSIQIGNSGNGADSTNNGSASINNSNTTNQTNSASVVSGTGLSATTGHNDASKNVGDSTITTGDANVTGTLITNVNTNVDAVMVSEFNIVDDHIGDILLDFAANCVSGCASGNTTLANTGNGAGSNNTTDLDLNNTDETFQTNDATVENTMILKANSGDNEADKNTGGNSTITTGDANINANMLTFANNNIAGDVIYGIVNIYGNLVGDIILPDEMIANCCGSNTTLANANNGAGSNNTTNYTLNNTDESFQTNDAFIENTLLLDVDSGDNDTNKNTGGNNSITTGDTTIDANVLNIANTNVDGGTWWLVLVNQAGQWIGHILGADGDASYAGSAGTEFIVDDSGAVTAKNTGNGADSTNTTNITENNTNTTNQTNTAHISNVVDLTANTGGNSASKNTGGDNSITTGDATVIANIVNFVNNNIIGQGKLLVTVVNVFGSWLGDFVTPGSHQDAAAPAQETAEGTGGAQVQSTSSNSSSGGSSSTSNSQSITAATNIGGGSVLAYEGGSFTTALVLSETITNPSVAGTTTVAGKNVVHINLAWLIFLLPCAIILFAFKRMRKLKTQ